jgi:sn-glycerol 3-phosphate transport system ATP-binding protein
VRPEDLRFGSAGTGGLPFARDFIEELGATRLFHGTSGDVAVVVAVAAGAADEAGGAVTADPEAVHLFDAETGNSLRRGANLAK